MASNGLRSDNARLASARQSGEQILNSIEHTGAAHPIAAHDGIGQFDRKHCSARRPNSPTKGKLSSIILFTGTVTAY